MYSSLSSTTVALPLSAGRITMSCSFLSSSVAWRSPLLTFDRGGFAQHHVTTSLMKLAIGEQNVATNLGIIFRLCRRILLF